MKKYVYHVLLTWSCTITISAQSMQDALRYALFELAGTARYMSISGAFNALGGDLSAISDNPAAGGVFVNSELNVTLNTNNNQIKSNYLENENKINSENSNINQVGAVLVLKNTNGGNLSKLSFAYNYQRTHNYQNKLRASGVNKNNGLDDYFLAFAKGIQYGELRRMTMKLCQNHTNSLGIILDLQLNKHSLVIKAT